MIPLSKRELLPVMRMLELDSQRQKRTKKLTLAQLEGEGYVPPEDASLAQLDVEDYGDWQAEMGLSQPELSSFDQSMQPFAGFGYPGAVLPQLQFQAVPLYGNPVLLNPLEFPEQGLQPVYVPTAGRYESDYFAPSEGEELPSAATRTTRTGDQEKLASRRSALVQ